MHLTVTKAKAKLTELIKRAEAGEEVILTRHGHDVVRLVALHNVPGADDRKSVIARVRESAARKMSEGTSAARSQDFLYGDAGLPQ